VIEVSVERVRELLDYNQETGVFRWRVHRSRGAKRGQVAGSVDKKGYILLGIDGRNYPAHRVAWAYVYGEWPSSDLDHRDLDKANNAITNLRVASRSDNMGNTAAHVDNSTRVKGVCFDRRRGQFYASICKDGVRRFLGYFSNANEAGRAYERAANAAFGEFARAT
jgi:hypothetical protein